MVADKLQGVITIQTFGPRDFTPEEINFVETVAGELAFFIVNAQLYQQTGDQLHQKVQELTTLQQVSKRIAEQLDPSPQRKYDVGRLLLLMRRFPEAGAAFNTALASKPDMAEALYGLGVAYDALGRVNEAIDAYTRALKLNLDFTDAHFNLARVLAAQGRRAEAMFHYERVLQLRSDDREAAAALAALRAEQRQ